jgi:2-oxoglutarate dehydrogenase E2 component (dihydrolipoamide succinyltransferase)
MTTSATTIVEMPPLDESVTEGTVTRWLKQQGDRVEADEPLLEVATDKVDTEIPAPASGYLLSITVPEDGTADVGAPLAVIGDRADADAGNAALPVAEPPPAASPPRPPGLPSRCLTPLVHRLAAAHGVDLETVVGTGPGNRILRRDVLAVAHAAAAEASATASPKVEAPATPATPAAPELHGPAAASSRSSTVALPRLRQVIAQRMTESLRVSAQLTTVQEVDITRIARLRAQAKAEFERREGVKLTTCRSSRRRPSRRSRRTRSSTPRSTRRAARSPTTAPCTSRSLSTPPAACWYR